MTTDTRSTLEKVQDSWKEDSKINIDNTDEMAKATIVGGNLHHKYMTVMSKCRNQLARLEQEKNVLQYRLQEFYLNNLYVEELERRPSNRLAKTKDEALKMTAVDPEMIALNLKISELEEVVLYLKEVVEYIRWNRTKDITNHIDWIRLNGM
jgi:predicted RNase H-like nuclease (RuvC/YqgF family)